MPELPNVAVYVERLEALAVGRRLEALRLANPFILRTVDPPISEAVGRTIRAVRRIGKRIVLQLDNDVFIVVHLMIAGRLKWRPKDEKPPGRITLAVFELPDANLVFTEAGTKRRASLHLVRGEAALAQFERGGLEVLGTDLDTFAKTLVRQNHTLKRALTDPRIFSGIGNAYSDEILHRARLSPVNQTQKLEAEEIERLFSATIAVMNEWIARLRAETADGFPEKVTAFHGAMAVHGRFGQPCPVCGTEVQRIRYADNETNYCPRCQTEGKLLADRSLSRLLKKDWPKRIDELEEE
jgi:formamidopyrimidine-DNA glycosylase